MAYIGAKTQITRHDVVTHDLQVGTAPHLGLAMLTKIKQPMNACLFKIAQFHPLGQRQWKQPFQELVP
jgi:hypothetical protein